MRTAVSGIKKKREREREMRRKKIKDDRSRAMFAGTKADP